VLVVEDESLVLLTVRHYLEQAGYRVLAARSGPEAVDCCTRYPGAIDLLLTDMVLPGMSGQALAGHAAELKPGVKQLFMSAHPRETLEAAGRLDPAAALIQKPFTAEELLARVGELLSLER
jgi:CheY-like chemotaxis protein